MTPTCYVCGRPIRSGAVYIPGGLYRHKSKCKPGSTEYMRRKKWRDLHNQIMGRPNR